MIIYGTRYYFKRDRKRFHGVCSHCNREGELSSYTASRFDHLYFIPIIPRGKHRVLDDCPHCHHVRYVDIKEWERAREEDFGAMRARLASSPDDPKVVLDGLGLAMVYMERPMYETLAEGALLAFRHDPEVMELTWAAAQRMGDHERAQQALAACVAAGASPEACLAWAGKLAEDKQLEEACTFALRAIEGKAGGLLEAIPALAECALREGQPRIANRLLRNLTAEVPQAAGNRRVRRLVSKVNSLSPETESIDLRVGLLTRLGDQLCRVILWGALALALLAGAYLTACVATAYQRTIYVLNGTPFAASLRVDGEQWVEVPASSHASATLAEGRHTVEARYANGRTCKVDFRFSTPFFDRPLADPPAYLLNPDASAVVRKQTVGQATAGKGGGIFLPGTWRTQENIDFAFRRPTAGSLSFCGVLSMYRGPKDLRQRVEALARLGGEALARQYLEQARPWYQDRQALLAQLQERYRVRSTYPFFLVNGLERSYSVQFAGRQVKLPALGHARVLVKERALLLSCPDPALRIAKQVVKVPQDFWRKSANRNAVHVVNPDRRALLARSEIVYGARKQAAGFFLHGGRLYMSFSNIRYPFSPPPQRGRIGNSVWRLRQLSPTLYSRVLLVLMQQDAKRVRREVERRLACQPDDETCLALLQQWLKPPAYLQYLRQRLSVRPPLVNLHRQYQELMERKHPEHGLLAEYQGYLRQAPGESDLQYLLASVTPDTGKRLALLRAATGGRRPCLRAFRGLVFDYLCMGRFREALPYLEQGLRLVPDNDLRTLQVKVLTALGRYDELLAVNSAASGQAPTYSLLTQRMRLLVAKGEVRKAEQAMEAYLRVLVSRRDKSLVATRSALRTSLLRYQGRTTQAATLLAASKSLDSRFIAALYQGRYARARKLLAEVSGGKKAYLLPLLVAAQGRDQATECACLQDLVQVLAAGDREERSAAAWLEGKRLPRFDEVRGLPMPLIYKVPLLAALGLRVPALRRDCFALAARLNFDLEYPHWIVATRIRTQAPARPAK